VTADFLIVGASVIGVSVARGLRRRYGGMASKLPYDAHPYLREGMVVEVRRGPLEGLRGILLRKAKRHRLVISIHLIRQAAAVEIDDSEVIPL